MKQTKLFESCPNCAQLPGECLCIEEAPVMNIYVVEYGYASGGGREVSIVIADSVEQVKKLIEGDISDSEYGYGAFRYVDEEPNYYNYGDEYHECRITLSEMKCGILYTGWSCC